MATLTVIASISDTPYRVSSVSYTDAQQGVGTNFYGGNIVAVGQTSYDLGAGDRWEVYRACLIFDTSALGAGSTINSATLKLFGDIDQSVTDFDIVVVDGSNINDPPVIADYQDLLSETASYGSVNSSTYVDEAYNEIALNSSGLTAISKTGNTKFGIRSSRDITPTDPGNPPPTNFEYIEFDGYSISGQEPTLVIEYTPAFIPKIFYF